MIQRITAMFAVGNAAKIRSKLMVIIAVCVVATSSALAIEQSLTPVDRPLPDFSLQGVDGELYEPDTLKGKTWLINFWAVWCAPCLEELPALNNAWAQLKEQNVGMLAINIGEDADAIAVFLKDNNLAIDFPIVIGDKIRTLGNWSGRALPHTVVVSPAGRVVYEAVGPREWDEQPFIDAVVALNDTNVSTSLSSRLASMLTQFHRLSTPFKVVIVAALILLVVLLMYFIRRLGRQKSTA